MGVDYISWLPEPALHDILSFLTPVEIFRARVLSKTRYQVSNNFQIMEFDFSALCYHVVDFNRGDDVREGKTKELYDSAEKILLRQRGLMTNFNKSKLIIPDIYGGRELVTTMNRWIGDAIDVQVKELIISIDLRVLDVEFEYNVPQPVFNAKCIQVLHLCGLLLNLPFADNLKLFWLKGLRLKRVYIDDSLISKFLSGNPLIEDLSFTECCDFKKLHVFALVKLQKIHVNHLLGLEQLGIDSSNLQSMHLEGFFSL